MDGYEVLEKLKADEALNSIPVIMITNMGGREDVEKANSLGAAGYLIKAHTLPKDVVRKIQSTLA